MDWNLRATARTSQVCDLKEHYVTLMATLHNITVISGFNQCFIMTCMWPSSVAHTSFTLTSNESTPQTNMRHLLVIALLTTSISISHARLSPITCLLNGCSLSCHQNTVRGKVHKLKTSSSAHYSEHRSSQSASARRLQLHNGKPASHDGVWQTRAPERELLIKDALKLHCGKSRIQCV